MRPSKMQCLVPALLVASLLMAMGKPSLFAADAARFGVRDYGAAPDDQKSDGDAIRKCLAAASAHRGPTEIVFDAGVYLIDAAPGKRNFDQAVSLVFQGMSQAVMRGISGKTHLVFTNPSASGLHLEACSKVTIKDLIIDYNPVPYAQGTIRNVDVAGGSFDLVLDDGSIDLANSAFSSAKARWGFVINSDPAHDTIRYGPVAVGSEFFQQLDGRLWRLVAQASRGGGYENAIVRSGMKPGDRYVHLARTWGSAMAIYRCENIRVENVTILSSPGLAFFPHLSRGVTLVGCQVRRLSGRLISTDADGIHARGMRGDLTIKDCSFEGMADDAINIHSSPIIIVRVLSPREIVATPHTWSVRPGDVLCVIDGRTLQEKGRATVAGVESTAKGTKIELRQAIEGLREGQEIENADRLYNLSEAGGPFEVVGSYFGAHRGRAIVLSARGGRISGNRFENNEGWGIDMSVGDTIWAEGPSADDIVISHNIFIGKGGAEPSIVGRWDGRRDLEPGAIRPFGHLVIRDNEFVGISAQAIRLWGAHDSRIEGARILYSDEVAGRQVVAISLDSCSNIAIGNLEVKGPADGPQIRIGATVDSGDSGFHLIEGAEKLPAILDLRKP